MEPELFKIQEEIKNIQDKLNHLDDLFFRQNFIDKSVFTNPVYLPTKTYLNNVLLTIYTPPSPINARSYGTGVTTIPDSSETKLTLASNSFANGVTWDATNSRLTILTAGQYLVTAFIAFGSGGGATAGKLFQLRLKKSNSEINLAQVQGALDNNGLGVSITEIVDCAVGAYFEIFAYQNSGVNKTIANDTETCYLSIAKI